MKIIGTTFLVIGIISVIIQNTFYGYVDAEGILRDSTFLPLGVVATLLGVCMLGLVVMMQKRPAR